MSVVIGDYEYDETKILGTGSFATVYKGINVKTHQQVAIKKIDIEYLKRNLGKHNIEHIIENIISEIKVMQLLHHPNIIKLIEHIEINNTIYLIVEYCLGGDLDTYIKSQQQNYKVNEATTQLIMTQIMNGLKYMHSVGIVHRDLKPKNILLSKLPLMASSEPWTGVVIKIADFGLAKYMSPCQMTDTICGSPLYMSPELFTCQKYTDMVDLWSFGVIMYELLFCKTPISANNLLELAEKYKNNVKIDIPISQITKDCENLLSRLLTVDYHNRIQWDKFVNHIWFTNAKMISSENNCGKQEMIDIKLRDSLTKQDILSVSEESELFSECKLGELLSYDEQTMKSNGEHIISDIKMWIDRVKILIHYGNKKIKWNCYGEGCKIFLRCCIILSTLRDITEKCVALIDTDIIGKFDDIVYNLLETYKLCIKNTEINQQKINPNEKCKNTNRIIIDLAASLENKGHQYCKIENKKYLKYYSDCVILLKSLIPFLEKDEQTELLHSISSINTNI